MEGWFPSSSRTDTSDMSIRRLLYIRRKLCSAKNVQVFICQYFIHWDTLRPTFHVHKYCSLQGYQKPHLALSVIYIRTFCLTELSVCYQKAEDFALLGIFTAYAGRRSPSQKSEVLSYTTAEAWNLIPGSTLRRTVRWSLKDSFAGMQQKATVAQVRQAPEICLEGLTESTKEPETNRCHVLEIGTSRIRIKSFAVWSTCWVGAAVVPWSCILKQLLLNNETVIYLLFELYEGRN